MRQMYKGGESKAVHTAQLKTYLADGWTYHKAEPKQEPKELSRDELAESLGLNILDEDGKKLHYKLIDSLIKEAQDGDKHHQV